MESHDTVKILIADDEKILRLGMSRIMSQAGFDLMEAASGEECIRLASEGKPGLILLDVMLGDMNGVEVCQKLKSDPDTSGIPILLVSSTMKDLESQAIGMEYGADGCIAKPVNKRELVARVRAILRIKESEKRLSETLDFLNKVLSVSPVGIGTFKRDGTMLTENKSMMDIFEKSVSLSSNYSGINASIISTFGLNELADDVSRDGEERRREVCWLDETQGELWFDCFLNRFKSGDDWNILLTVNDITQLKKNEKDKENLIGELSKALSEVKTLSGFLPICASCKKIRDDSGYWTQIESYIRDHSEADFTHSICPDCARKLYPDIFKD